jgi:hypothetical protein
MNLPFPQDAEAKPIERVLNAANDILGDARARTGFFVRTTKWLIQVIIYPY